MGVELTTEVAFGNIELSQITEPGYLNEIGRLNEMSTLNCSWRDETGSVVALGAPGHFNSLSITNHRICAGLGRCIKTKIVNGVKERVLACRVGARLCTTLISTGLPRLCFIWCIIGEERRVSGSGEVAGN